MLSKRPIMMYTIKRRYYYPLYTIGIKNDENLYK